MKTKNLPTDQLRLLRTLALARMVLAGSHVGNGDDQRPPNITNRDLPEATGKLDAGLSRSFAAATPIVERQVNRIRSHSYGTVLEAC